MDKKLSLNGFDLLGTGLVFVGSMNESEIPYTTPEVVAKLANRSVSTIRRRINENKKELEEVGGKIGYNRRPSKSGQIIKTPKINEAHFTLLITFLKNNEPVKRAKVNLVKTFFQMKSELEKRKLEHQSMKPTIKTLDDAIHDSSNFNSKWDYGNVKKLIYQKVLGMSLSAYQRVHNIPTNKTRLEFMSEQQLSDWNNVAELVIVYIKLGYDYEQLKSVINGISLKVKISANKAEMSN